MLLETPKFWRERGLKAKLLLPFSWFYGLGHCLKTFFSRPYTSTLPVICVGGVVAGGSGKTPCVHELVRILRDDLGYVNPVILTRGYGGILNGPSVIDLAHHTYMDVGDEALLHAARCATIVSKDRAAGARLAEAMGADIIVMDDGLQNNSISKTLSLLVVDGHYKTGNGYLLPAGPLREPLTCALKKCAAILQTNGGEPVATDKPVITTSLKVLPGCDSSRPYVAFAGLGHPEKFMATLQAHEFMISDFKSFPDHYPYTEPDMENIIEGAGLNLLITTEKDFVRIPAAYQPSIHVLKIAHSFDQQNELVTILKAGLHR